ncbi:phospholipase A2 family protein [Neisseria meningitidis]|uniref:phospholipase A2 family protein n=1 Tax=Neisseria meningitidis TaxID=487 RepID=UPI0034D71C9E
MVDNPYTELYDYSCDSVNKKITCGSKNNECEMFICECDRKAAECFGVSPWNPDNEHLPNDRCR